MPRKLWRPIFFFSIIIHFTSFILVYSQYEMKRDFSYLFVCLFASKCLEKKTLFWCWWYSFQQKKNPVEIYNKCLSVSLSFNSLNFFFCLLNFSVVQSKKKKKKSIVVWYSLRSGKPVFANICECHKSLLADWFGFFFWKCKQVWYVFTIILLLLLLYKIYPIMFSSIHLYLLYSLNLSTQKKDCLSLTFKCICLFFRNNNNNNNEERKKSISKSIIIIIIIVFGPLRPSVIYRLNNNNNNNNVEIDDDNIILFLFVCFTHTIVKDDDDDDNDRLNMW